MLGIYQDTKSIKNIIMIKVHKLLETRDNMHSSNLSTDFERNFIRSICKDKNLYKESKIYGGNILDRSSLKEYVYLSEKQEEIYLSIEYKYNNKSIQNDLFEKYTEIFKEKGIVLDSFDLRHLETFKGVMKESENFKKWVSQLSFLHL